MYKFIQANGYAAVSGVVLCLAVNAHAAKVPLKVLSQPSSVTIFEGQPVSFKVTATSGEKINYTWYKNGSKVSVTGSAYTISKVGSSSGGTYSCLVTSGKSKYTCKNFTLKVKKIARITKQPTSLLVNKGTVQRISVRASGDGPLSYQWYKNGKIIKGATSTSITFRSISDTNVGRYHCVVRSAKSSATSNAASVKVLSVPKSQSVRLTWSRPEKRANGKKLASSEIRGYNIYYSNSSSGAMTRVATLSASEHSYVVSNLSTGTHYFSASTLDTMGLESARSARVSRTFE